MKRLYLTRHAKSNWKDTGLTDFERPLNKRGKRDAPFMGKLLNEQGIKPDLIISSAAVRAVDTAKNISEKIGYRIDQIIIDKSIYEADSLHLFEIIKSLSEKYNTVMLIGHNPDLTYFANYLGDKRIDNIPTCGIVTIEFDTGSWRLVQPESGKIISFEYPKKYG
ncbi:MAG: phosphohistidine phosphatase [Ignavibacteria bacterium RBG_13_36_8]|nr:MAG: phosphohistidine phosphatase [Ignavibacteria bacterium RBG_13_36_8]